eukprot:Lithocolla_globosa_v1_NODE_70_length_7053_cov_4.426408.p3 type:complete len:317 gc:universal NODE_70_length_7053_cov_4.426408:2604-1654(-)
MRSLHDHGLTPPPQSVNRTQHAVSEKHPQTVQKWLRSNGNAGFSGGLDDYTDIWEKKEPETVTTVANGVRKSVVKTHNINLMATFTLRRVPNSERIPFDNECNVAFVDVNAYQSYLRSQAVSLSLPYREWKLSATGTVYNPWGDGEDDDITTFRMVCHHYDLRITQFKCDRHIGGPDGARLVDCFGPWPLKSQKNYGDAVTHITTNFPEVGTYVKNNLLPMCCDFPGNQYIRKQAMHFNLGVEGIDPMFGHMVSVVGILHESLNSREMTIIKFIPHLWLKFYQHIFGANKKLAKKPKPWRMALILQLDGYSVVGSY